MKIKRLLFCLLLSVSLTVTLIPMTSFGYTDDAEHGTIIVSGWTADEGGCVWTDPNTGAEAELSCEEGLAGDEYECVADAGDTVYIDVSVPEGLCVDALTINDEEYYPDEDSGSYEFIVASDEEYGYPANVIDISLKDDEGDEEITIDDCGTIVLNGWIWDDEDASWRLEDEDGNYIGYASIMCPVFMFDDDNYPHAEIGCEAYIYASASDEEMRVKSMTINGVECWDDSNHVGTFTVQKDKIVDGVRKAGNVVEVTFENEYGFDDLTEELKEEAITIRLNQEKEVNTEEKEGLFAFTPTKSGKYVFYSCDSENSGRNSDPVGRVLDSNGKVLGLCDDADGLHFQVFFDAEADQTYYLQAVNYDGDAIFMVGVVENDIVSISLQPKKTYVLRDVLDTETGYDEEGNEVHRWDEPCFDYGDNLIVTKKNGSRTTYVYTDLDDGDEGGAFINENDDEDILPGWPEFIIDWDDWTVENHPVGSQTQVTVAYGGYETKTTVKFVENPYKKLTIVPETGIHAEVQDGGWYIVCGDTKFVFTTANGTTVEYVYRNGLLYTEDATDYISISFEPVGRYLDENENYVEWELGNSYQTTVSTAGFEKELTVSTAEHVHVLVHNEEEPANCTYEGRKEYWTCTICGRAFYDAGGENEIEDWDDLILPIDEDAHNYDVRYEWDGPAECLAIAECPYNSDHDVTEEGTITHDGTIYTATFRNPLFETQTREFSEDEFDVLRIQGTSRYETSRNIASFYQDSCNNGEDFDSVVIATGQNFPDALAGSYLAGKNNAPIIMINEENASTVATYVRRNLVSGGTIYVLGGDLAVKDAWLGGLRFERLSGASRYETNLKILREADVNGGKMFVCTGTNFPDALSCSAINTPILLVGDQLTTEQKEFLDEGSRWSFHIIGGTLAVKPAIESQLSAYGRVDRTAGTSRYDTSKLIAEKFVEDPREIILATGKNFPDGLCGGPVASTLGAPIILTDPGSSTEAEAYAASQGINSGIVLGGQLAVDDATVRKIFQMGPDDEILEY